MNSLPGKEKVITAIFLLLISLPVLGMFLGIEKFMRLRENRSLAQTPKLSISAGAMQKYPFEYTKYFNDNFGFRKLLVMANFIIRHDILGGSPSKEVVLGKEGWLFYTGEGSIEDDRGITKHDAKTLEEWVASLEIKRTWLEKRGIRYLLVIAPNKSAVYGEYLPAAYNRVRERISLDDLLDYLKKETKVEVVDIRPALMSEKNRERLYLRTDTHWNEYGAFIAYQQIMQPVARWFPAVGIHSIDDYRVKREINKGGDLARMIGGENFLKDEYITFEPLGAYSSPVENINDESKSPVTVQHGGQRLPRALVFRDSFFSSVAPYFADHFDYSRYYWQYWISSTPIEEMLETVKPDVVVEELAQRRITLNMANFVKTTPKFIVNDKRGTFR